jgi:hypothetical protein
MRTHAHTCPEIARSRGNDPQNAFTRGRLVAVTECVLLCRAWDGKTSNTITATGFLTTIDRTTTTTTAAAAATTTTAGLLEL